MEYDSKKQWTKHLKESEIAYPSEYVIRIFKGSYPKLNFDKTSFKNKKICDVGCGDGRNLPLLVRCGFDTYGVDITEDIVDQIRKNIEEIGIEANIKVGTNDNMPFEDEFFDFLLSWNTCYYMGEIRNFNKYIKEFSRVLKKDGYLILSIPKKSCFIYKGCERIDDEFVTIKNDPFNMRNGETFRIFKDEKDIEMVFSKHFKNFIFGSIEDDCFGLEYHWHLVICQKK